ncbi:MAG: AAA family ATPase [Thermomicrobiales bacterium]
MSSSGQPLLVIVTGPPATGKTSIASDIASMLAVPAFHKDDFKECLADELPGSGLGWSRQLGRAAYYLLFRAASACIEAGQSCLLEANFHPELSLPNLRAIARNARVVQVVCSGDPEILMRRYMDRYQEGERHPIQLDADERRMDALRTDFRRDHRLALDGLTIECDTTRPEPVDVEGLVSGIRAEIQTSTK